MKMRKYYQICRIDPIEIRENDYSYEKVLIQDSSVIYDTEEECEQFLEKYFKDFPKRAINEEYAIVKCYKLID